MGHSFTPAMHVAQVEDLDFQLRQKNTPKALEKLQIVKSTLDDILAQIV